MKTVTFVNFVALVTLSACAYDRPVGLDSPQFGESVRHNVAASTVNPAAPTDRAPLTFDAQRASVGQGRYVNDTVEPPALVGTQATQTGGVTGQGSTGASSGAAPR